MTVSVQQKRRVRTVSRAGTTPKAGIQPWRQTALIVVMVVVASALTFRLVFWQVIDRAQLVAMAAAQRSDISMVPALRGDITDDAGNVLAADERGYIVYSVPRVITNPAGEARALTGVLKIPYTRLRAQLATNAAWLRLSGTVPGTVAARVRHLQLNGIVLQPVPVRVYPGARLAAQVLGFVNANGGQYGIEGYYDRILSGRAGVATVLHDTAGHRVVIQRSSPLGSANAGALPAQAGATLHLSIDSYVQWLAQSALDAAVKRHSADGGTIIVMDPRTGYIRAMANDPSYDPNHVQPGQEASWANPAIAGAYEPGSTFKIITMAAGLDTHLITPSTAFDDTGVFRIANVTIHNWNLLGNGWETMTQVLQHSANVGASWVANRLGTTRFYHYVKAFGFGSRTGVDLQGEAPGTVYLPGSRNWSIVNLYTNSYGQGIAVTPLQLITAVSAVANGGWLMRPQVVTGIDYRGRTVLSSPIRVRRVISRRTATTLTNMLVQSAMDGEAQRAMVSGYRVAAKTGTASVAAGGSYVAGDYIASTIGYAPASNPRFVVLVILRHPRDIIWGSVVAAPIVHDLCAALLLHYHIAPSTGSAPR